jgi:PDZ domain-containing protein
VDTLQDMVPLPEPDSGGRIPPPPPPPEEGGHPRRGWRVVGIVATTLVMVLVVQVIVLSQLQTPWIAFEPGSATSTDGLLAVNGTETYVDDEGQILYLTVRQNRLTALEWVVKARDPHIDIEREKDLYGDRSASEVRQENLDLMDTAKSQAELAALDYLGYDVFDPIGAQVVDIEAGSASDGALEINDVITAIDGTPVAQADELISVLRTLEPGVKVSLDVQDTDGTGQHTVEITLGARPDGTGGGFLGISTSTWYDVASDIPIDIDIDSGEVGGNSAGLAFSLSIIDLLTPGSLTGDHTVAVTGTMSVDGTVGDVGGVAQKAVAARRAGAQYMLVPRNLESEALKNSGDMQVIPVSTLQEALDALANLGGNADDLALPGTSEPN